jgi:hypothetical protein
MDEKIFEKIIDAYEELSTLEGGLSPEDLFTTIADRCNCDFDTVCEAIAAYSGREPLLKMYLEYDNTLSVKISPEIGSVLNNEDVSDDNSGIAYYGILALAHGISSLAAHINSERPGVDTILEHISDCIREGFEDIGLPIEISIKSKQTDQDNAVEDSAGKLLHFPSNLN